MTTKIDIKVIPQEEFFTYVLRWHGLYSVVGQEDQFILNKDGNLYYINTKEQRYESANKDGWRGYKFIQIENFKIDICIEDKT